MKENLTDKIKRTLKEQETDTEVKLCLANVIRGHTGRQQISTRTTTYCCRPKNYCPLQTENITSPETKLPECDYISYILEEVERHG